MLSRDGSSFGTMFSLPQGGTQEGKSDENPIVLTGETASEFRHFLSALYALYVRPAPCSSALISLNHTLYLFTQTTATPRPHLSHRQPLRPNQHRPRLQQIRVPLA
jgi:hypothetical protein